MAKASHRRPQKRGHDSLLERIVAALPRWAVLPFIGAVAGLVYLAGVAWHLHDTLVLQLVVVSVGVMAVVALASLREKARSKRLLVSIRRIEDLRAMSPGAFEELVLSAYRACGWPGSLTQRGADGGVDVILQRDGERIFVQCKRFKEKVVRVDAIRSLKGVMAGEGVARGIFVSSGRYTSEALQAASSYGIETIDGFALLDLVREARGEVPGLIESLREDGAKPPGPPSCPRCHDSMVMRKGPRGRFWGCARYPSCRGTQSLTS